MTFDHAKFAEICAKTHTEQAIWWLNGFWKTPCGEAAAEELWKYVHLMIEIEAGKPKLYGSKVWVEKEGCDLDEMQSHIFLEKTGEALTVMALRKKLSALDIDNNKRMALSEFMLNHFTKTPKELCEAPQGDIDPVKLKACEEAVSAASAALNAAVANKEAADKAATAAAAAKSASDAAEAEVKAAVDDLKRQEDEHKAKIDKLEATANDTSLGAVKKNKAANELAQLKAEDPLPLRKAKITQEAALKKAEKAAKKCAEEKLAAEAAAAAAAESLVASEQAFEEAEKQLKLLTQGSDGVSHGKVWWMNRELAEKKKFMPRK